MTDLMTTEDRITLLNGKVDDLTRERDALRSARDYLDRTLTETRKKFAADIKAIGDAFLSAILDGDIDEDDYDRIVAELNANLQYDLPDRVRPFSVTGDIRFTVTVEATDEDTARGLAIAAFQEAERELDGLYERDLDSVTGTTSALPSRYDYQIEED